MAKAKAKSRTKPRTKAVGRTAAKSRGAAGRNAKSNAGKRATVAPRRAAFRVEPERVAPGEREPLPQAALDRRRQIVGTDDPGTSRATTAT